MGTLEVLTYAEVTLLALSSCWLSLRQRERRKRSQQKQLQQRRKPSSSASAYEPTGGSERNVSSAGSDDAAKSRKSSTEKGAVASILMGSGTLDNVAEETSVDGSNVGELPAKVQTASATEREEKKGTNVGEANDSEMVNLAERKKRAITMMSGKEGAVKVKDYSDLISAIGCALDEEIASGVVDGETSRAYSVIRESLGKETVDPQDQVREVNRFSHACQETAVFFQIVEELCKEFSLYPEMKKMRKNMAKDIVASAAVGVASAVVRSDVFAFKGRSWKSSIGFFPDPRPEGKFLTKDERDSFRASLLSWLKVQKSNRLEYGGGMTMKLDVIYEGEWDFQHVRDVMKKVMKDREPLNFSRIAGISNDADEMKCLLNAARGAFTGIMVNNDGFIQASFDCASTFYSASKAFICNKVSLALEMAKTVDPKVVTTTLNQADLGYIKDWDSASAMVLLESFIIRAASDARVATAITSAELFAESGNTDLFNCCGCLRADACHDHPDLYPGANKAGRAATVARLVLLQAVKAGVEGFGACVSSYSNDGKVLTVVFFETSSGCQASESDGSYTISESSFSLLLTEVALSAHDRTLASSVEANLAPKEDPSDDVGSVIAETKGTDLSRSGMLNVAGRGMTTADYIKNIAVHSPIRGVLSTSLFLP